MLSIIITQHKILVWHDDKKIALPSVEQLTQISNIISPITQTSEHFIAGLTTHELPDNLPTSLKLIGLRQALNHFDDNLLKTIIYYQQLNTYYETHRFCGTCGEHTIRQQQNKFVRCNQCNHEVYPHIAPCIIVRIHKDNDILMARGVGFAPGTWGLIAGFVEVGETLENAVMREVKEEVGIEISNIRYWGSQPWPFPSNSLMVGFTADYKSGEIVIDPVEIEQAGFYSKHNTPGLPFTNYSIASRMIREYLA